MLPDRSVLCAFEAETVDVLRLVPALYESLC